MSDLEINPGDRVMARTAFGELVPRRAATGPMMGEDFMVVRVCGEEEWAKARAEGRQPITTPWPAEDVFTPQEAVDA